MWCLLNNWAYWLYRRFITFFAFQICCSKLCNRILRIIRSKRCHFWHEQQKENKKMSLQLWGIIDFTFYIMKSILFSYYEKYTFQLQHLKTVCDSNEQLCWQHPIFCVLQCPDRDLIFLDDVLGTIITPNGAGAFPDVTPHDIYTLIYTGNSSPTTSESTSHPILLCISSPTTFSLSPPPYL